MTMMHLWMPDSRIIQLVDHVTFDIQPFEFGRVESLSSAFNCRRIHGSAKLSISPGEHQQTVFFGLAEILLVQYIRIYN